MSSFSSFSHYSHFLWKRNDTIPLPLPYIKNAFVRNGSSQIANYNEIRFIHISQKMHKNVHILYMNISSLELVEISILPSSHCLCIVAMLMPNEIPK